MQFSSTNQSKQSWDQDDEEQSKGKKSFLDSILRKNGGSAMHSMPANTRISELSNIANISQDELLNMSADRKAAKRPAESSGMHWSYSGGQASQVIDGADPDSTINQTRDTNESTTKKKKGFFNIFRKKSKPMEKATEDSVLLSHRSESDEHSATADSKKRGHMMSDSLLVQNVPYDKDMQARVDQYSLIRSRDANEDGEDDTVKSFADGGQNRRVEFYEVPDSTRTAEYQQRAGH